MIKADLSLGKILSKGTRSRNESILNLLREEAPKKLSKLKECVMFFPKNTLIKYKVECKIKQEGRIIGLGLFHMITA